jgi:hypothetical protein
MSKKIPTTINACSVTSRLISDVHLTHDDEFPQQHYRQLFRANVHVINE